MNNSIIPASMLGGKALSSKFAGKKVESLGEGIRSGFGIIGYRGKVWHTKYQGVETPLMRDDGDGPRNSIEVVIVKASNHISKIYYESGYVDGSTAAPDCFSTDGVKPDAGANKKQASACAGCPKNAWGSKITEAGKPTKACGDSKRLAVVPLADLKNEAMGGPMLLRCPAASLKDLKIFGDMLQQHGFPYFGVATKISFDVAEAFPKFTFAAARALTDPEADIILELQESVLVNNILNTSVEIAQHEPEAANVPKSVFETAAALAPSGSSAAVAPSPEPQASAATPAVQPTPAAPASAAATAGDAAKPARKRRTKAEMIAAAEALLASKNVPSPTVQATNGAAPVSVTEPTAAAVTQGGNTVVEDFEDELESLIPK